MSHVITALEILIQEKDRRIEELLEANNAYLDRARKAEAELKELRLQYIADFGQLQQKCEALPDGKVMIGSTLVQTAPEKFMGSSERRDTFAVPHGWTAERDAKGVATGYLIRKTDGVRAHHSLLNEGLRNG